MRVLAWIYAKLTGATWEECPRCKKMFGGHEARGSMIVAFGPCDQDDELSGEFVESKPTCCGPDQLRLWLHNEPWWAA